MVIDDRASIIRSGCFYLKKSIENFEFIWLKRYSFKNIYVVVEEVFVNRGSQQVMWCPCYQWVALTDWNKLRSPALGCWYWPSQWTGKRRNNCKTAMKWTFSLPVEFWFESWRCTSFYTSTIPLWRTLVLQRLVFNPGIPQFLRRGYMVKRYPFCIIQCHHTQGLSKSSVNLQKKCCLGLVDGDGSITF